MAFAITFNGLTLDGVSTFNEDNPLRINADKFPRRQGAIVPEVPFLDARIIRASGTVFKDTEAALKSYRDNFLHGLLNGKGRLKLRDDSRYLNAVCSAAAFGYRAEEAPATTGNFTVEWTAGDPYWYSETQDSQVESDVSESPHSFSVANDGQAKTPVRIQIKALSADKTDVTLTNSTNGLACRFSGTILSGKTLTIDGMRDSPKVDNAGVNGFPLFTGSFWLLESGTNNLIYEGPTGVDVSVFWRERWE